MLISANNSTLLRYLKKTRYSAIIRLLFGYDYIRASSNRAGNRASTEHNFGFKISSFDST